MFYILETCPSCDIWQSQGVWWIMADGVTTRTQGVKHQLLMNAARSGHHSKRKWHSHHRLFLCKVNSTFITVVQYRRSHVKPLTGQNTNQERGKWSVLLQCFYVTLKIQVALSQHLTTLPLPSISFTFPSFCAAATNNLFIIDIFTDSFSINVKKHFFKSQFELWTKPPPLKQNWVLIDLIRIDSFSSWFTMRAS